jgi:hypothetical protein
MLSLLVCGKTSSASTASLLNINYVVVCCCAVHLLLPCRQAGRDPPGYRDSEIFKACQKGMEHLRMQMREARQAGELTDTVQLM